jgi:hypothetical protein
MVSIRCKGHYNYQSKCCPTVVGWKAINGKLMYGVYTYGEL